jgi:hypothetical protein
LKGKARNRRTSVYRERGIGALLVEEDVQQRVLFSHTIVEMAIVDDDVARQQAYRLAFQVHRQLVVGHRIDNVPPGTRLRRNSPIKFEYSGLELTSTRCMERRKLNHLVVED